jgi:hypothetical protein
MSQDATVEAYENVGFDPSSFLASSPDATFEAVLNVGFEIPPTLDVLVPQKGWGTPIVPTINRIVILNQADATAQSYEGDVT